MVDAIREKLKRAREVTGDALLLFRMGDFFELYDEDAKVAARTLGLTLTSRDKDSKHPLPMAGFPHHQLDAYLVKLVKEGNRVVVCEDGTENIICEKHDGE